jgi:hypothetical protein
MKREYLKTKLEVCKAPNRPGAWWFRKNQRDRWRIAVVRAGDYGLKARAAFRGQRVDLNPTTGQWVFFFGKNVPGGCNALERRLLRLAE